MNDLSYTTSSSEISKSNYLRSDIKSSHIEQSHIKVTRQTKKKKKTCNPQWLEKDNSVAEGSEVRCHDMSTVFQKDPIHFLELLALNLYKF